MVPLSAWERILKAASGTKLSHEPPPKLSARSRRQFAALQGYIVVPPAPVHTIKLFESLGQASIVAGQRQGQFSRSAKHDCTWLCRPPVAHWEPASAPASRQDYYTASCSNLSTCKTHGAVHRRNSPTLAEKSLSEARNGSKMVFTSLGTSSYSSSGYSILDGTTMRSNSSDESMSRARTASFRVVPSL